MRFWILFCTVFISIACVQPSMTERNEPIERYSNFITPPQCGKSFVNEKTKIVSGQPAEIGAWPWMAHLGYKRKRKPELFWSCKGALISDRHVLTAAYCIDFQEHDMKLVLIRLGEHDDNGASPLDVQVASVIAHPNFRISTKFDDIGLVKLQQPVGFTRNIQPICLPKPPELRTNLFVKSLPFIAGWDNVNASGLSSPKLIQVQVSVVDNDSCDKAYKSKGASIIERQLCAGHTYGGEFECLGDGGGPLMLPNGSYYYLIGVISFGYKCAEPDYPGVYTRVTSYLDWISENM